MVGNIWTNHRNQKDMEELLGTIATYMATATDDEYEEIAQTIRHDLVYSQYGQDITHSVKSGTKFPLCFPQILPLVFGISRLLPSATSPGGVFTARVALHRPFPQARTPSRRAFVLLGVLLQREGIVGQPFSTTASYFFKASFHLA